MRDNTRRNRNIGTAKQGHGQNNKMQIAEPMYNSDYRSYFERLEKYKKETREINGHEFVFITEELRQGSYHSCSVEDVCEMIKHVPPEDYGELKYIIFRQPKRKENIISPVWGRLIYSYEFEGDYYPAIILESFKENDFLKWPKSLSVERRIDMERLKRDGHQFIEDKRHYIISLLPENVRSTQLYRTLLHEFGHYVQYLTIVGEHKEDEETEEWEKRWDFYHESIPSSEKEVFAHTYADRLRKKLEEDGVIPFSKKE